MRLSLANLTSMFGVLMGAVLIAATGLSAYTVNEIRIGSALYEEIVESKDLVGDILPPPLYVVEAYLEANLARNEAGELSAHKSRLSGLHKDYEKRRRHWANSTLPANLKVALTEKSHAEATRFWNEIENNLVPSLESGDATANAASFARLAKYYKAHRAIVDGMVVEANARAAKAETQAEAARSWYFTLLASLAVVPFLLIVAAILLVRSRVLQPLSWITFTFTELAAGDTQYKVYEAARNDEIGELGRAYGNFRQIVLDSEANHAKMREQEEAIEAARKRVEIEKAQAEAQKAEALRAMIEQVERETKIAVNFVIDLMEELTTITSKMSGAAGRLSETSASVSTVAEEALTSMQSASSSTKDLSDSIDRVADRIHGAKATSDEAVVASRQASASIEALSKVTTEIDEVTGLIAQITRQTGLLALNAGVEAARAGNEGLGFAVIAREVRSLAEQTSAATDRIGSLINQVQESTVGAVAAVDNIAKAIDRVSRASEEIANAIRNQVNTTKLIATNVDGTTSSVTNVTKQIQYVATEGRSTREMAENVEDVCSDVTNKVRMLQTTLVKIVRTCSAEVDRRTKQRIEINRSGAIDIRGTMTPIKIVDISEGGAQLTGDVGQNIRNFVLHCPGIDMPLESRVVANEDGVIRAEFTLADTQKTKLALALQRIAKTAAPTIEEIAA